MKMKLLTFYSDSHTEIYENFFLKSYNLYLSESFELYAKYIPQISPTGEYNSKGFSHTMLEKIHHIINNIDITDVQPMVFSDCDVQFFSDFSQDIIKEIGNNDIAFQDDVTVLCAGFFICKQNIATLSFFEQIYRILKNEMDRGIDDQVIINNVLRSNPNIINFGVLPSDKYYTVASTIKSVWNGQDFTLPSTIFVHHANWTVGIKNKLQLLNIVREKVLYLRDGKE